MAENTEEEFDMDKMSDEEFMAHLEEPQEDSDEIDDEIADEEEADTDGSDDDLEDNADLDSDEEDDKEDTDTADEADDEDSEDTETNDQNDEDGDDTEESDDEDADESSEEDTQDGDDSDDDVADDADQDSDEDDTKDPSDGKDSDTSEINYKEQYEKFKSFYDDVTSEFVANGKTVRGFSDPEKIKQAQQMAAGFSDKMAGFKQYRPYMAPLKERGMLENEEKFNMAMSLIDGDKEALKQHIKNLNIDPMDLDMDEINYNAQSKLASQAEITLDDVMESAEANGIKDKVQTVLGQQWDRESVVDLLGDPQSGSDLIEHMSSGVFDAVQERIAEKKRYDAGFSSKNSITQYREAAAELERDYKKHVEATGAKEAETDRANEAELIATNAKKAEDAKKAKSYKAKVEKKNIEASKARKKATSVSKKRAPVKSKKKVAFDPMSLSDEDFTKYFDEQVYG